MLCHAINYCNSYINVLFSILVLHLDKSLIGKHLFCKQEYEN